MAVFEGQSPTALRHLLAYSEGDPKTESLALRKVSGVDRSALFEVPVALWWTLAAGSALALFVAVCVSLLVFWDAPLDEAGRISHGTLDIDAVLVEIHGDEGWPSTYPPSYEVFILPHGQKAIFGSADLYLYGVPSSSVQQIWMRWEGDTLEVRCPEADGVYVRNDRLTISGRQIRISVFTQQPQSRHWLSVT